MLSPNEVSNFSYDFIIHSSFNNVKYMWGVLVNPIRIKYKSIGEQHVITTLLYIQVVKYETKSK
jgi:hypothetical protein